MCRCVGTRPLAALHSNYCSVYTGVKARSTTLACEIQLDAAVLAQYKARQTAAGDCGAFSLLRPSIPVQYVEAGVQVKYKLVL